jgi:hypothetical protein
MACRKVSCTDITSGNIPARDNQQIYNCLASKYVKVGSNICEQFERLSGCSGAPALWYKCGDLRPDTFCPARPIPHVVTSRIRGLICAKNPPNPHIVCPPKGSFAKRPKSCDLLT